MISIMKTFNKLLLASIAIVTLCFSNFVLTQETQGNIASSEVVPITLAEGIQLRAAERRVNLAELNNREAQLELETADIIRKTNQLKQLKARGRGGISAAAAGDTIFESTKSTIDLNDIKVLFWVKDVKPARAIFASESLGLSGFEIEGEGQLAGEVDIKINSKEIVARYEGKRKVLAKN